MDESSDFHSNSLPQSRPEIPPIAPRTPEPLVRTPPTPPTPSSADPPTPQSNPRVNSITTRATLRTPVRDSRSPSTPSRSATDRSYSPLSRYVQTPELYLPRIPTARQRRLDNDQRMLLHFAYMLTDAIAPPLEDICRMIRLQCGHYIASMVTDIIDSIPNPLITPCVHLLFAYHFLEPEVLDVTNDIHAQLVPYVLRVVTSLSYLIHVTIPCGILAPLYSFMIDHRWIRSFSVFISTFSHMFILLCETLQTLHDELSHHLHVQVSQAFLTFIKTLLTTNFVIYNNITIFSSHAEHPIAAIHFHFLTFIKAHISQMNRFNPSTFLA